LEEPALTLERALNDPVRNSQLMMCDRKYVVFDFDGTIADTLELAFAIYNRIAPEYNLQNVSKEEVEVLRSRKPQEFLKSFGLSHLRLMALLLRMQKELNHHIAETALAKGMGAALESLRNAGYSLGVLTSNSRENVMKFLDHKSLSGIMDFIYSGKSIFGKDKVITRMLGRENIERQQIVYVGDETRDIEACRKAGIRVIAVSWGLNSRDLLTSLHPDFLADDPAELLPFVKQVFTQ
jgi:phosphoglycolate phosphatase